MFLTLIKNCKCYSTVREKLYKVSFENKLRSIKNSYQRRYVLDLMKEELTTVKKI